MNKRIAHIALVVKEYDEAIQFYTGKLGSGLLKTLKWEKINDGLW